MTRQPSLLQELVPEASPRTHDLAAIWAEAGRPIGLNPRRRLRGQDAAMVARVDVFGGRLHGDDEAAAAYQHHLSGE